MAYRLEPGTYRAQIIPAFGNYVPIVKSFTLAPPEQQPSPPPEAAPEVAPAPEGEGNPETAEGEGETAPETTTETSSTGPGVRADLRGVINAEGFTPSFSIILNYPDGRRTERNVSLGGRIYGRWKASEFSPARKTLTVTDGNRLLIVKPGESLDLEGAESELPPAEGETAH